MRTRTKTYGFAALALAVLTLAGCGGGSGSSSTNTGGGGGGTTPSTNAQWTWVSGDSAFSTTSLAGSYGTLGTPSASNQPAGRIGAAYWTDSSGNFYLFGGVANSGGNPGFLNDLWRYNPSTNQWTWLSGANYSNLNQSGNYGTMNVAASTNVPGGRYYASFWKDANGNLYLFGGEGVDKNPVQSSPVYMNDLWKYNIASNQWTWIGGTNVGANTTVPPVPAVYGTLGTPAGTNQPGVRGEATSFTDASGNFWLFGGKGADSTGTFGNLSDMWKYSTTTNQWTWVAGPNTTNQAATYGTMGTAAAANTPSGRYDATSWTDSSGNLWLFGGNQGATTSTSASFATINDLWKFTPANGQWTWIGGSNSAGATGVYGTKGTAASANIPGARAFAASWADSSGNLYLFGGAGGSGQIGTLFNDLWKYSVSTGQWAWIAGTNGTAGVGVYGKKGTSAASNLPGGRFSSSTWIDGSGNLWLFGGNGFDSAATSTNALNDLWKYQP